MVRVPKLSQKRIVSFRRRVWSSYRQHRRDFPWRRTDNPYRITISEVMLQQTQAQRVAPKYEAFVRHFSNWQALARASASAVLRQWSGLGYNRRAVALRDLARAVVREHNGKLPRGQEALEALPGIGPATAAAIRAFAFGEQSVYLDTNVRGVYIYEFFPDVPTVSDAALVPLIQQTLVGRSAREWYYALLDYGAWLKASRPNPTRRSAHYVRAGAFEGSSRQLRGRIVAVLLAAGSMTRAQVVSALGVERDRVTVSLDALERDGLLRRQAGSFALAR